MKPIMQLEIGLWVSPPATEITAERYAEIKEAGFTFVIGLLEYTSGGEEMIIRALDAAQSNGLKYIVHDPRLKKLSIDGTASIPERIAPFLTHPAYLGHLLKDEPSSQEIDSLAAVKEAYVNAAPDRIAYVNLFPNHAAPELLGAEYVDYLKKYMQQYKPQVLSYDHYPFLTDNSVFAGDRLTEDYYYNLELMRKASVQYDVPFWLFIQTLAFNGTHRDPTEAEIKWQVYTSLAFGAKGIQYFTYWTPDDDKESFGDAIIDRRGNRTRHYTEVQTINRELKMIGSKVMSLRSEGVIFWGEHPIAVENTFQRFGPIHSVEGDAVVIGCFVDENSAPTFIVVNGSYDSHAQIHLNLQEHDYRYVNIVSAEERSTIELPKGNSALSLHFEPGAGMLLHFQ